MKNSMGNRISPRSDRIPYAGDDKKGSLSEMRQAAFWLEWDQGLRMKMFRIRATKVSASSMTKVAG